MQEELMLRLYNHVYADPVYWNNLGVEKSHFSAGIRYCGR